MSRLTDLLQRHAAHHQPLDFRLLESVIRQEKLTCNLTIHYRGGEPKLIEAGRPIVVELEPTCPFDTPAHEIQLAKPIAKPAKPTTSA